MMDRKEFLYNLWLWKCDLPEKRKKQTPFINLKSLKKSEWSKRFEILMRNRLVFGAIRYGKIKAKNKPIYNRIESIQKRLKLYNKTGNKEYLVDCANLCLLEFEESLHPNKHFNAIDDGEHVNIKKKNNE